MTTHHDRILQWESAVREYTILKEAANACTSGANQSRDGKHANILGGAAAKIRELVARQKIRVDNLNEAKNAAGRAERLAGY